MVGDLPAHSLRRAQKPSSPCPHAAPLEMTIKVSHLLSFQKKRHKKGTVKNVNHFLQSLMILVEMRGVEPLSKKPVP